MEDLEHALVGEEAGKLGRIVAPGELDQHCRPVAFRQLHEAEPVTLEHQTHRLGVDGDRRPEIETVRQVAAMELDAEIVHPVSGR
ncbi:hypothetical protein D3C83_70350 [compost metagenome]